MVNIGLSACVPTILPPVYRQSLLVASPQSLILYKYITNVLYITYVLFLQFFLQTIFIGNTTHPMTISLFCFRFPVIRMAVGMFMPLNPVIGKVYWKFTLYCCFFFILLLCKLLQEVQVIFNLLIVTALIHPRNLRWPCNVAFNFLADFKDLKLRVMSSVLRAGILHPPFPTEQPRFVGFAEPSRGNIFTSKESSSEGYRFP